MNLHWLYAFKVLSFLWFEPERSRARVQRTIGVTHLTPISRGTENPVLYTTPYYAYTARKEVWRFNNSVQ